MSSSDFRPLQFSLKFNQHHWKHSCATVYKIWPSQSLASYQSPYPHVITTPCCISVAVWHYIMKYCISCLLDAIMWSGNSPRMRTNPFRQWTRFQRLSWFVETCCFQSEFPFYYSFIKFHYDLITLHRYTAGSLRLVVIGGRCFYDTRGWKWLLRLKKLFES